MGILKPGAAGKVGWLTGMAGTPIFPYFRYFFPLLSPLRLVKLLFSVH